MDSDGGAWDGDGPWWCRLCGGRGEGEPWWCWWGTMVAWSAQGGSEPGKGRLREGATVGRMRGWRSPAWEGSRGGDDWTGRGGIDRPCEEQHCRLSCPAALVRCSRKRRWEHMANAPTAHAANKWHRARDH